MCPVRDFTPFVALLASAWPAPAAAPVALSNRSGGPIAVSPWLDAGCTQIGRVLFRLCAVPGGSGPPGPASPLDGERVVPAGATLELSLEQEPDSRHASLFRVRRLDAPDRRTWAFRYTVVMLEEGCRATILPSGFSASTREVFDSPGPDLNLLVFRQPAREPGQATILPVGLDLDGTWLGVR